MLASILSNIHVVLDNTSHPGNIGSVARAMYTMGLTQLRLVNPQRFPHADAVALASGAVKVLDEAKIYQNLSEALRDIQIVFATSARDRDFPWPVLTPKEMAAKIFQEFHGAHIALLFGTERYGLSNEALEQAHYLVQIPANQQFSSLNLAQAVQVLSYEIYQASLAFTADTHDPLIATAATNFPTVQELQALYVHLQQVLQQIEFLDPAAPRLLMRRIKRLVHRAQLETAEVQILRGMLKAIARHLPAVPNLVDEA